MENRENVGMRSGNGSSLGLLRRALGFPSARIVAVALLAGCATPEARRRASWPSPYTQSLYGAVWHDYRPEPMATPEEAIGAIKNLQDQFCAMQGYQDKKIDVDRFGLRMQTRSVVVSSETEYVPSLGHAWVGRTYVPIYGGTYRQRETETPVSENVVIPFNKVHKIELLHLKELDREYKWMLRIYLEGDQVVALRALSRGAATELANAIATLVAPYRPLSYPRYGLVLDDLSPEQLASEGVPRGVLVLGVAEGGWAARAGLRYGDLLIRINGQDVASAKEALHILHDGPAGEVLRMTFLRWEKTRGADGREAPAWVERHIEQNAKY